MKININKKQEQQKAEVGDLIQFNDGVIALVTQQEGVLMVSYLLDENKRNWFKTGSLKKEIGDYKILSKAKDWEINVR